MGWEQAIEELKREMPPPAHPFAAQGDWAEVERRLGLPLPDDYKAYIETYGSGKADRFVCITNPFSPGPGFSFWKFLENEIQNFKSYIEDRLLHNPPYPNYPEPDGLLPFGTTENCNTMSWLTKGTPDTWEIVTFDVDFLALKPTGFCSIVELILGLVQGKNYVFPCKPRVYSHYYTPPPHPFKRYDPDASHS